MRITIARPSPDGTQILYLVATQGENGKSEMRMMRVPASGGAPQFILQTRNASTIFSARVCRRSCASFGVATAQENRFVAFDPVSGQQTPLGFAVARSQVQLDSFARRPDDCAGAVAASGDSAGVNEGWRIARVDPGEANREFQVWTGPRTDKSLWASSSTFTGTQALLNIDLRGRVHEVFQDPDKDVGWAIPSTDGRHIAFWEAGGSSNAWVLKAF